jgi:thymidine kinase
MNGIAYDFSTMNEEKIARIFAQNQFKKYFEDVDMSVDEEFIAIDEKTFFSPEEFDEIIKEIAEKPKAKKNKK